MGEILKILKSAGGGGASPSGGQGQEPLPFSEIFLKFFFFEINNSPLRLFYSLHRLISINYTNYGVCGIDFYASFNLFTHTLIFSVYLILW